MNRTAPNVMLLCLAALGCSKTTGEDPAQPGDKPGAGASTPMATLTVTSAAFPEGGVIPARFTCEGENVSPPLAWSDPPAGTKSFAVVVDDPDAPDPASGKRKTFVHWVVYDLPPSTRALPEAARNAPAGGRDGENDFERQGYGGPCPPSGRHRYFFKVYALDVALPELKAPGALDLDRAMRGHVLARGQLIGTYEKGRGPRT